MNLEEIREWLVSLTPVVDRPSMIEKTLAAIRQLEKELVEARLTIRALVGDSKNC